MKIRIYLILFCTVFVVGVAYASYQPHQTITQGGTKKNLITDLIVQDTLDEILYELKIMNLHLEQVTGENFTETDIE